MRRFNTTGLCVPRKHYMVDISGRVERMREMVAEGDYFCVNRARQYGKTTALAALRLALRGEYAVASLDFQGLSHESFRTEGAFARAFARALLDARDLGYLDLSGEAAGAVEGVADAPPAETGLGPLFASLTAWIRASDRPVVLIVDEVDSATNNQVLESGDFDHVEPN